MARWTGLLIGYCGLALVAALLILRSADATAKADIAKLIVQFLVVTAGGAIVAAWLNARRDADQRELARQAAIRDLARDVNAGYRRFKSVKRRLRAQVLHSGGEPGARKPPFQFEAKPFEASMDELLEAQIAFEILRDTVGARSDLLVPEAIERIVYALNYAARYFHDVYQDFENGRVVRRDGRYEAGDDCQGLADFLGRRAWSDTPATPWWREMEESYRRLEDPELTLRDRYQALRKIIELRQADKRTRRRNKTYAGTVLPIRRHRIVATEAIDLAFLDIQQALPRNDGAVSR